MMLGGCVLQSAKQKFLEYFKSVNTMARLQALEDQLTALQLVLAKAKSRKAPKKKNDKRKDKKKKVGSVTTLNRTAGNASKTTNVKRIK